VSRAWRRHSELLIALLVGSVVLAVSFGAGLAVALSGSTEVGQTTSSPDFGVGTPVAPFSTVPGTPSYATPQGVLTSWRFHSSGDPAAGAVRLKIFRYIGNGSDTDLAFKVLAESSLKTLEPDTAYDFKERIPVDQGDLLGLTAVDDAEVGITVPGTPQNRLAQFGGGDIPPGQTGTATIAWPDRRPSVAATVEADADGDGFGDDTQDKCPVDRTTQAVCQFSFGKLKRNTKRGTAVLPVTVPGAGTLSLSGRGVAGRQANISRAAGAGGRAVASARTVKLVVKGKGKKKKTLNETGKVKLNLAITYAPNGGDPSTQSMKVKLKKKL
jgi:hypothetical protein